MTTAKKKDPKFNLLACSRRSKYCMGPIVAEEGRVIISSDLASGEPVVLLNLTEDATLYSILYEMRGKRPYYTSFDNVLMTDSLYITTMSNSMLLAPLLKEKGEEWINLYEKDPDAGKDALGSKYKICKALCLAMIYGLGYAKLARLLAESGILVTDIEAKGIIASFWDTLPDVKEFKAVLTSMFKKAKKKGEPFISPFGFPLPTGKPNDCMNFTIQSGVSSWVRRLNQILFADERLHLIAVVHDELLASIAIDDIDEYKIALKSAQDRVNHEYGLKYPLTLGWKVANNFAEIK